ncbi:hypothetical protein ACJMK2_042477 [Sinanodonta woodiana]|uniref:Thromboxane A2 receptor n=1 Tax=Sinanodonta woodiana TaxID=1069815 RepID=A0ABD3WB93_SINWO
MEETSSVAMGHNISSFSINIYQNEGSSMSFYLDNVQPKSDVTMADLQLIQMSNNSTSLLPLISLAKTNNTVAHSSAMFTFGVLGNILALIVLRMTGRDIKRRIFYRLVGALTLTDFLGITMTSPVVIAVYVNDFQWIGGHRMCQYFGFIMIFSGCATVLVVCLMSIERFLCLRHPYQYHVRFTTTHATAFILLCWAMAAVMATLPLIGFGNVVLKYPYTWCFIDYYTQSMTNKVYNCIYAGMSLICLSVTVSCNITVIYTLLKKNIKPIKDINSRRHSTCQKRYAECEMVVLLIGISVVFTTCYAPFLTRIIINQTGLLPVQISTDLLFIRLASMNQILDPWIYILLRREVVRKVISTIKACKSGSSHFIKAKERNAQTPLSRTHRAYSYTEESMSCCQFCFHCLCDPSQSNRYTTVITNYSDHDRRRSTCQGSSIREKYVNKTDQNNGAATLVHITMPDEYFTELVISTSISDENRTTASLSSWNIKPYLSEPQLNTFVKSDLRTKRYPSEDMV